MWISRTHITYLTYNSHCQSFSFPDVTQPIKMVKQLTLIWLFLNLLWVSSFLKGTWYWTTNHLLQPLPFGRCSFEGVRGSNRNYSRNNFSPKRLGPWSNPPTQGCNRQYQDDMNHFLGLRIPTTKLNLHLPLASWHPGGGAVYDSYRKTHTSTQSIPTAQNQTLMAIAMCRSLVLQRSSCQCRKPFLPGGGCLGGSQVLACHIWKLEMLVVSNSFFGIFHP